MSTMTTVPTTPASPPGKSWRRRVLTCLAVLAGLITAGSATSAVTAQAATVPVIYNSDGWNHGQVRPQWIPLGAGGSVAAHTWHWNTWGSKTATSTGTLWVNGCVPNCAQGRYSYHKLYVTLYWVKSHSGVSYFYGMKWYTPGFRMKLNTGYLTDTSWLHFSVLPGASVPFWH